MTSREGPAKEVEVSFAEMDTDVKNYLREYCEVFLEAELLDRLEVKDRTPRDDEIIATQKKALREIDRLVMTGTYEEELARLRKPTRPEIEFVPDPTVKPFKFDPEFVARLNNFMAGLRSPDPAQRARFQKFSQAFGLGSKTPRQIVDYLWALEPAKDTGERGRPKLNPPWLNVAWALDEMRLKQAGGLEIVEASRQVAEEEGQPGLEERAKYFRRHYRARQKLRE